jgi:hypothetical protein
MVPERRLDQVTQDARTSPQVIMAAGAGPDSAAGGAECALPAESALRPVDLATIIYLLVSGFLALVFLHPGRNGWSIAAVHALAAIVLPFLLRGLQGSRKGWKRFLLEWYPMLFFFALYEETALINAGSPIPSLDPWLSHMDDVLFGAQLSEAFPAAVSATWFQEAMAFSYASYYLFIPGAGFYLWFRNRKKFASFLFTLATCFYFCYLIFIIFPSGGPQMYLREGVIHWDGVIFGPLLTGMLTALERCTGAFPSSHIAIAFIIVVTVWREKGFLRYIFAVLFIGLFMATVYGGPHYGIDLPAGLATGTFFLIICMPADGSPPLDVFRRWRLDAGHKEAGT